MTEQLYDVIEVQIDEPRTVRVLDTGKTERNAEAIINMAIMRRGVETCFYTTCPPGEYADGDTLKLAAEQGVGNE